MSNLVSKVFLKKSLFFFGSQLRLLKSLLTGITALFVLTSCGPKPPAGSARPTSAPHSSNSSSPQPAESNQGTSNSSTPLTAVELYQHEVVTALRRAEVEIHLEPLTLMQRNEQELVLQNLRDLMNSSTWTRSLEGKSLLLDLGKKIEDLKSQVAAGDPSDQLRDSLTALRHQIKDVLFNYGVFTKITFGSKTRLEMGYFQTRWEGLSQNAELNLRENAPVWTETLEMNRKLSVFYWKAGQLGSETREKKLSPPLEPSNLQEARQCLELVEMAYEILAREPEIQTIRFAKTFSFVPSSFDTGETIVLPLSTHRQNLAKYLRIVKDRLAKAKLLNMNFYFYEEASEQSDLDRILDRLIQVNPKLQELARKYGLKSVSVSQLARDNLEVSLSSFEKDSQLSLAVFFSVPAFNEAVRQFEILKNFEKIAGVFPSFENSLQPVAGKGGVNTINSVFDRSHVVGVLAELAPEIREGGFGFEYIGIDNEHPEVSMLCCNPRRLLLNPGSTLEEVRKVLFDTEGNPRDFNRPPPQTCEIIDGTTGQRTPCATPSAWPSYPQNDTE
ncbi:MAG: hypothetical protein WCH11_04590 [Bdellovibrio sp.]